MGVSLHAHPGRGESHIQHNANGEVATISCVSKVARSVVNLLCQKLAVPAGVMDWWLVQHECR